MREKSDRALEELQSISERVYDLQDVVHSRIRSLYDGEQKVLVFHETMDDESVLLIMLVNLNRVIAKYKYKTRQNNLYLFESDIRALNSNKEYEPVVGYLKKLENALIKEYDCLLVNAL